MARYAKISRTTGKVIEVTESQSPATPKGDDKGDWRKVDGPVKVGDTLPAPTPPPAEPKTDDPA